MSALKRKSHILQLLFKLLFVASTVVWSPETRIEGREGVIDFHLK
jgi:hypothetical protein